MFPLAGALSARHAHGRGRMLLGHLGCSDERRPIWLADTAIFGLERPARRLRMHRRNRPRSPDSTDSAGPRENSGCPVGAGSARCSIAGRTRLCRHGRALPVGAPDYTLLRSDRPGFVDSWPALLQKGRDLEERHDDTGKNDDG